MSSNYSDAVAKTLLVPAMLLFFVAGFDRCSPAPGSPGADILSTAFENHRSDFQVEGEGTVIRMLSDDTAGDRHQRFILRLASKQTVLVVHNIDLAPRIDDLKVGDKVLFNGEYQWNAEGGLIHWTHHDPQGRHTAGWIKHDGHTYQ